MTGTGDLETGGPETGGPETGEPEPEGPEETSLTLLQKVRSNDTDAWERLVKLYEPVIISWCLQFGLKFHDAENVVQELFLSLSEKLDEFERRRAGSFRKWIKTVVRNKCVDWLRKSGKLETQTLVEENDLKREINLDNETANSEKKQLYQSAIQLIEKEFSRRDEQIFHKVIADGMPPKVAAADFDVSINVVYLAVSRILKRLRQEFHDVIEIHDGFH